MRVFGLFLAVCALVAVNKGFSQGDPCDNVDFNKGNFEGWRLTTGCQPAANRGGNMNTDWRCTVTQGNPDYNVCCPVEVEGTIVDGDIMEKEVRHRICRRGGNDPYLGVDLPLVPPQLDGFPISDFSVRLGNARRFAQAESLERTFMVDSVNALFVYEFAFVLNDPPGKGTHTREELPFFEIVAFGDGEEDIVPCSNIRFESNSGDLDSLPNVTNNDPDKANDMPWTLTYQKWKVAFLDLTDRIGEEVTIKVTNADCALTGHFGYTYFVAHCMPFIPPIDVTICAGDSVTLVSPWPMIGYDLEWLENGVVISTEDEVTVKPTVTTTYTLKTKNKYKDDPDCNNELEVTVFVGEGIPPTLEDKEICTGGSVTLEAMPAGVDYEWFDAATGGNVVHTGDTYELTNVTTDLIFYVSAIGECASDERVPVKVTVTEVSADAGPDVSLCTGGSAQLNASGGSIYEWRPVTGLDDPRINNPNASPTETTVYIVTVTDASGKCVAEDTVVVNIGEIVADAGPDKSICLGDSAQLNASGGDIYSWTPPLGLSNVNIANPKASPPATTTYTVTVQDQAGLCEDTDVVIVKVEEIEAKFEGTDVCVGFVTDFTNLTTPIDLTGADWLWDFSDGNTSNSKEPSHTYATVGTYKVLLSVNAGTCSDTFSTSVNVHPNPVAAFTPAPKKATADDPVITFTDQSVGAATGTWNFGDGEIEDYLPLKDMVHGYYATDEGEGPFKYTITLSVESEYGCKDEVSHPIEIENIWSLFVPNSFTPNGDGINDYFKAYGIGILEFKMTIFNRWGEAVYRGDNIDEGWDGSPINGSRLKQDLYVWKVKAVNNRGKTIKLVGHVSLLPGSGNQ